MIKFLMFPESPKEGAFLPEPLIRLEGKYKSSAIAKHRQQSFGMWQEHFSDRVTSLQMHRHFHLV